MTELQKISLKVLEEKTIKVSNGNSKLGDNCLVISRPVGDTCPSSCDFLHNGCYAEQTEKMYKNSRLAAMVNLNMRKEDIFDMLLDAKSKNKSIVWFNRN